MLATNYPSKIEKWALVEIFVVEYVIIYRVLFATYDSYKKCEYDH